MNVYVESNFVLDLALLQEQSTSCGEILSLGETNGVQLVVPAYSLAEPYETLTRRQKQRKRLKEELDAELGQIARTATFTLFPSSIRSPGAIRGHRCAMTLRPACCPSTEKRSQSAGLGVRAGRVRPCRPELRS